MKRANVADRIVKAALYLMLFGYAIELVWFLKNAFYYGLFSSEQVKLLSLIHWRFVVWGMIPLAAVLFALAYLRRQARWR